MVFLSYYPKIITKYTQSLQKNCLIHPILTTLQKNCLIYPISTTLNLKTLTRLLYKKVKSWSTISLLMINSKRQRMVKKVYGSKNYSLHLDLWTKFHSCFFRIHVKRAQIRHYLAIIARLA